MLGRLLEVSVRVLLILLTAAVLGSFPVAADDPVPEHEFIEERVIPESWNPPRITVQDGQVSYVPPTPNLIKRRFGTSVNVRSVGVSRERTMRPVGADTWIKPKGGALLRVAQGRTYKINGQYYKVLGEAGGVILLKNMKTRGVFTLPRYRPEWRESAGKEAAAAPEGTEGE